MTRIRGCVASDFRQYPRLHILDDVAAELTGFHFGGAFHQAFEVVGDFLLLDRALQAALDQVRGFVPAEEAEHHNSRENHRSRVDDVLVGVLRRCAVRGFETGVAVADVGAGSDAQASHLRGAGIGDIVAVEVRCREHRVLVGSGDDLLEDGVGNAVVDHELRLPGALPVTGVDLVEDVFHFFVDALAKFLGSKLQAGLDQVGILLNRDVGVLVLVVDDPAFALGDDPVAELFGREFVSPLAEGAFGELLDVALVHQGNALFLVLDCELDRHPYQALGSGNGDGLDADAGVEPNLLLAALEHLLVEEVDELSGLGSSLFPLDARVDVFGVLPVDPDIHAFGMLYRRGRALVVLHRAHTGIEIKNLTQGDVEGADTSADRRGEGALDGDAEFANGGDAVVGQPGIEFGHGFFAGEDFKPGHAALALIGLFHGRVEHANRSLPDVTTGAIPLNERDDRIVGNLVFSVAVLNGSAIRGNGHAVV